MVQLLSRQAIKGGAIMMLKDFEPLKINLQLFANADDGATDEPNQAKEPDQDADDNNTEPGNTSHDNLPKTQEELDAIIEKRLERERRKFTRQLQKQQQKQKNTQDSAEEEEGTPLPNPELERLNKELLLARAQLEAFRNGIRPDVVEDAVYLALREAEKDGEADEEDIKEALKSVLKRHPEWKSENNKPGGGFKVGATIGKQQEPATNDIIAEIFGNKK